MIKSNEAEFDRLGDAMRVYIQHRASGSPESDEVLLERHAELRDLLQPLLEQDDPESRGLRAGMVIGDYRLVERIGRGGMGEVWAAEQASLRRSVALKILRGSRFASSHSLERFQREALAGARLKHPCVVAVHAVGEHEGMHFIVQELVESRRTLASLLTEMRTEPVVPALYWRETAARFVRLAEALQLAHDAGVVHRDLKPSNILIAADGTPKIADFGLALVEGSHELSRTGELSGSPFYMSPEQASARKIDIDHRSDIFSLGATLYEALTLTRPFDGDTLTQVFRKILLDDPVDPRRIRSRCPRDLAVICLKMLEKERTHRYASMREVADELARFLRNQPIVAKPAGPLERTWKWCRRHPVFAASAAILTAAFIVVSFLLVENRRARRAAELASLEARTAESEARTAASTSARVVDFLVEAFASAQPENARGREVTALEVLDRGVELIRGGLTASDEAKPRARLLDSLGTVYARLGRQKESEALLREAMALGLAEFGPSDERYLCVEDELSRLYLDMGRTSESLPLATEVYEVRRRLYGEEAQETLYAETHLAIANMRLGEFETAERRLRHAQTGLERLGMGSGAAAFDLSEVLQHLGRLDEAKALVQRVYDDRSAQLGADHTDTLIAQEGLARIAERSGHPDEALRMWSDVWEMRCCVQGATHPDSLQAEISIATIEMIHDPAEATEHLQRIHATALANLGPEHSTTARAARILGSALASARRHREAESYLAMALAGAYARGVTARPEIVWTLATLGGVEGALGELELALSLFEEARELGGPRPPGDASYDVLLQQIFRLRQALHDDEGALEAARAWLDATPADHPDWVARQALVEELAASIRDRDL